MRAGKRHAEQAQADIFQTKRILPKKKKKSCQVEVEEINQERGI